jgi:hypothetical protein
VVLVYRVAVAKREENPNLFCIMKTISIIVALMHLLLEKKYKAFALIPALVHEGNP